MKSFSATRASRSVGVNSVMPLKRETSPICDETWLSAAIITPFCARLIGDGIDQVLRQAAIVEAGEQQQIAALQRPLDGGQHLPLEVGVGGVLAQMIDPQQGLVQRAETLLACRRPGGVGERIEIHAMLLERAARKACGLVVADEREKVDVGAKAVRMSSDRARAADEGARHQGRDDDGRVFLRHADGIAGDIFVDDQVADDRQRACPPACRAGLLSCDMSKP